MAISDELRATVEAALGVVEGVRWHLFKPIPCLRVLTWEDQQALLCGGYAREDPEIPEWGTDEDGWVLPMNAWVSDRMNSIRSSTARYRCLLVALEMVFEDICQVAEPANDLVMNGPELRRYPPDRRHAETFLVWLHFWHWFLERGVIGPHGALRPNDVVSGCNQLFHEIQEAAGRMQSPVGSLATYRRGQYVVGAAALCAGIFYKNDKDGSRLKAFAQKWWRRCQAVLAFADAQTCELEHRFLPN